METLLRACQHRHVGGLQPRGGAETPRGARGEDETHRQWGHTGLCDMVRSLQAGQHGPQLPAPGHVQVTCSWPLLQNVIILEGVVLSEILLYHPSTRTDSLRSPLSRLWLGLSFLEKDRKWSRWSLLPLHPPPAPEDREPTPAHARFSYVPWSSQDVQSNHVPQRRFLERAGPMHNPSRGRSGGSFLFRFASQSGAVFRTRTSGQSGDLSGRHIRRRRVLPGVGAGVDPPRMVWSKVPRQEARFRSALSCGAGSRPWLPWPPRLCHGHTRPSLLRGHRRAFPPVRRVPV